MSAADKSPRRFKPELVEHTTTTSKKPRRFAPEPISTTTRSSRKPAPDDSSPVTPPHGKEQNLDVKLSEPLPDQDPPKENPKPRRKFAVEPIETTTRNNRKQESDSTEGDVLPASSKATTPGAQETEKKPSRRKFAPQLIETAKRTRKSGDTSPAVLPSDKTNVSPGDPVTPPKKDRPSSSPIPPSNTPTSSTLQVPQLQRIKPAPTRQGSVRPHPNTRENSRFNSVRVPSLPDIESSESEEDGPPSLSRSRGDDSDSSYDGYTHATRMRESLDENFSGYLLALAAKAAEKQLREQEAAAFPNTDFHEPVAHFMNRSDSEGEVSEPRVGRFGEIDKFHQDSGDEKTAMQELRKHGEQVFEQQKRRQKTGGFNIEFDSEPSRQDIWTGNNNSGPFAAPETKAKKMIEKQKPCSEWKQMRKAASPPMLGGNITFPRCASPDHARFDVTQGADYLRRNVCYLSEQTNHPGGLWGKGGAKDDKGDKTPKQAEGQNKGLWGGLCNQQQEQQTQQTVKTPVGLVTPVRTPVASPRYEDDDEIPDMFSRLAASDPNSHLRTPVRAPPSPPADTSPMKDRKPNFLQPPMLPMLDRKLELEAKLDDEFNDAFVTQVYNYLSFGYPALARKYDEELARVTKIGVEELQEDDELAQARGYVRLGEDEVAGGESGLDENSCKRWRALRRYIKEWGRQMMIRECHDGREQWALGDSDPHRAWGLPGRRGSWGF